MINICIYLPYEIISYILMWLSYSDLLRTKRVCKMFWLIFQDPYFWKCKLISEFPRFNDLPVYNAKIYLYILTLNGGCEMGSEEFLPILTCLKTVLNRSDQRSVIKSTYDENEELIWYFSVIGLTKHSQDLNLTFFIAAIQGYVGILDHSEYINIGWDVLNTSLFYAAKRGHKHVVKWGIQKHPSLIHLDYLLEGVGNQEHLKRKILKWERKYVKKSCIDRLQRWFFHKII